MLEIERLFNGDAARLFSSQIKHVSVILSAIYVVLIFAGQSYMKNRPGFVLRIPLISWNILLTVFSVAGAIRTIPELVTGISDQGWRYSVCDSSFYDGQTGIWAYAFVLSKAYELGDTAFIVLRKQPLILLHWYHHITVFMYCFYSYPEQISSGRWFMVMNYVIHSLMYAYFTARALKIHVPKLVNMVITSLQIVQMVMGMTVAGNVIYYKSQGFDCHQSYMNAFVTILMYVSYFMLFIHSSIILMH